MNSHIGLLWFWDMGQFVLQCSLACHKKCLETLAIQCGHKKLQGRLHLFGIDFTQAAKNSPDGVPFIIRKCTSEIENRALNIKVFFSFWYSAGLSLNTFHGDPENCISFPCFECILCLSREGNLPGEWCQVSGREVVSGIWEWQAPRGALWALSPWH